MRKIDLTAIKAEDITDTPTIVTPMPEPIVVPQKLKNALGGEPDSMWIYRIADGSALVRWLVGILKASAKRSDRLSGMARSISLQALGRTVRCITAI